jgi:hypothetical protein
MTSTSPPASISVQSTFTHIDSRMPRNTMPVRTRRKPSASKVTGRLSVLSKSARLAANTRDCVAIEVSPEHTSARPTTKLKSGNP